MNKESLKREFANALLAIRQKSKKNSKGKTVVNEGEVKKEMNKFFKKGLSTALIALVVSTMLAGCDLESKQGSPSKGHYDFTPSVTEQYNATEIVTDSEGNEHVLEKTRELSDWTIGHLQSYFADRTIEDVINKKFTTQFNKNLEDVNEIYERAKEYAKNGPQITGSYITGETFTFAFQTGNNTPREVVKDDFQNGLEAVQKYLMGDKVNYAIHVTNPRDKTGSDLTYYRKGSDTAVFVIKQGSNTYLNGIYEGEFYTDGQDYFPEWFSFALNEQKASLLRQADITGAEFGDEILASLVSVHDITNWADRKPNRDSSSEYDKDEDTWYYVSGFGKEAAYDGDIVQVMTQTTAYVKYIRGGRVESIKFSGVNCNEEGSLLQDETLFQGYLEYQPQQSKIIAEEPQK